jgi:hypothetical protein
MYIHTFNTRHVLVMGSGDMMEPQGAPSDITGPWVDGVIIGWFAIF